MASSEVTEQINTAVGLANAAAKQVAELKGQLDSYGAFYQALLDYTGAVKTAAEGANALKLNLEELYRNTGTLSVSVGKLNSAACQLYNGTAQLASGTNKLAKQTATANKQINSEIKALTSTLTGNNEKAESFVSSKNTKVNSVQFVIKTAAIEKAAAAAESPAEQPALTFWQKLLRLFGLY